MPQKTPTRRGLIRARERRGWTQQRLADEIGSTFASISRWETGARTPTPYFRRKLVDVFQVTEEELDLMPSSVPAFPEAGDAPSSSFPPYPSWWYPVMTVLMLLVLGIDIWQQIKRAILRRKRQPSFVDGG